jgi:LysR family pca operon transcriptional activator
VKLFERGRHGAQPTREGQLFMPHATACVLALRQGVGLLARESGGAAATLEVGMLPTVAASLAPAVMRALAEHWPRVVVRLATAANTELLERLKAGAIECAIGRLSEPERMVGLAFEQLYNEPLVAVVRAGHPLMASAAPAAELARYPVVLPPYGTLIRQSAEQLLSACGAPPLDAFVEVLSVSVARALALENDAVWFVPLYAAEYDLAAGALERLPLPAAGTDEPVGLILRTDAQPSPVARTLIDAVREIARERFGGARPVGVSRGGRRRATRAKEK